VFVGAIAFKRIVVEGLSESRIDRGEKSRVSDDLDSKVWRAKEFFVFCGERAEVPLVVAERR
jgi:hypothetical protein